jgi:hypothetical protein
MDKTNIPNKTDLNYTHTSSKRLQQEYQEALLKSGIQAAKLLNELIELKLMPDPRAKEMADLALEVIKIIHSAPEEIVNFKENHEQP